MSLPLPSLGGPVDPASVYHLTNRLDLMEVLSSGLVAPANGLQQSFSRLAGMRPGHLLLFGGISPEAISLAEDVGMFAFPVALEFEFASMKAVSKAGDVGASDSDAAGPARAWSFAGALPYDAVKAVHFRSPADLETAEVDAKSYANVLYDLTDPKVSPDLFETGGSGGEQVVERLAAPTESGIAAVDFVALDRFTGAILLAASLMPGTEEAFARLASVLSAKPQPHEGTAGCARWLAGFAANRVDSDPGGEQLFRAATGLLAELPYGSGWSSAEMVSKIRDKISPRPGQGEERLGKILDRMAAILRGDELFEGMKPGQADAAKALLLVLMEERPEKLSARLEMESGLSAMTKILSAAMMGTAWGRKSLDRSLRPKSFDRYLAGRTAAWLAGAGQTADKRRAAGPSFSRAAGGKLQIKAGKAVIFQSDPEKERLAEALLRRTADETAVDPILVELCQAAGWHDCVHATFEVTGAVVVEHGAGSGSQLVSFNLPPDPPKLRVDHLRFMDRLRFAPLDAELESRFSGRLLP